MNSYPVFNRQWLVLTANANKHKYSSSNAGKHPPFDPLDFSTKYQLGAGTEQVVYAFPPHSKYGQIVIKESRKTLPWRPALLSRFLMPDGSLDRILNWREIAQIKLRDNRIISGIMGPHSLPSIYVHGYASDGSGNTANYCIQRRVTTYSLSAVLRGDLNAIDRRTGLRNDLLSIAWGARKVLLELGATPDFYNGKNVLFTENQRPVLSDTGFPSFLASMSAATDMPAFLRLYFISIIDFHLDFILSLEQKLCVTPTEAALLSAQFRVNPRAYEEQVASIKRTREELQRRVSFGGLATRLDSLSRRISAR